MSYHFSKTLELPFEAAIEKVTADLKEAGFGIITEIDVKNTLKEKLDVDFRKYKILGACNPPLAYQALQAEDKIGTMLPCNVIVQEVDTMKTEVSAVDPAASMQAIQNEKLGQVASDVRTKLKEIIEKL